MRYSRQNRIAMAAGQSRLDNMTDPAYWDDPNDDEGGDQDQEEDQE